MLRLLEEKGHVRHEQDGPRYVFLPIVNRDRARKSALKHVVRTFFDGSATDAVAALLDADAKLSAIRARSPLGHDRKRAQGGKMSLGALVLVAAVKGSVLLVAAWIVVRAFPRISAALRHLVWASALGGSGADAAARANRPGAPVALRSDDPGRDLADSDAPISCARRWRLQLLTSPAS